jgi:hypothetical protein
MIPIFESDTLKNGFFANNFGLLNINIIIYTDYEELREDHNFNEIFNNSNMFLFGNEKEVLLTTRGDHTLSKIIQSKIPPPINLDGLCSFIKYLSKNNHHLFERYEFLINSFKNMTSIWTEALSVDEYFKNYGFDLHEHTFSIIDGHDHKLVIYIPDFLYNTIKYLFEVEFRNSLISKENIYYIFVKIINYIGNYMERKINEQ